MPSSRSSGRTRSRESTSRRSRSSNRSRSRHSDGQSRSRRHSHCNFKQRERNFAGAVCNMITIVILCVALAEPKWVSIYNGLCSLIQRPRGGLHFLGAFQFFYSGHFIAPGTYPDEGSSVLYQYGPSMLDVMANCVTTKAVMVFKWVIAASCVAVICSLIAFLLDLTGPTQRTFRMLHRNAIFSILTVVICVIVNILCYFITTQVQQLQGDNKKVEVSFDVSFYLISAAGSVSVFAVACNCLRRYPLHEEPRPQPYLLDDCDDLHSLLSPYSHDVSFIGQLPPPPAYSPNVPSTTPTATTSNTSATTSTPGPAPASVVA
ncbi:transmembrane protein 127-like [Haliotis rufescens]|uniref:transmembrane protein 127-like n=1 Tax=Haliotis rufescens TaxID=6454 RepID=UPI00201E9F78|nr:transmembrane protein 127-like [Haliotis rufescens]